MSTLFISYSTIDRAFAERVYDQLMEMGYERPFRDDHPESGIPAGTSWESELYRKLRLSRALVVLVSEHWLDSKWCFAELAHAKAMGKDVFPILVGNSNELPPIVAERQCIPLDDPDVWTRLERGLRSANLAPENDFPWPVEGFDECPYPGLASFEAHQAGVYFGRDQEIDGLGERLRHSLDSGRPRLLYVAGASGTGKSSLVKAGLVPRLKRDEERWCVFPTIRWNELEARGTGWEERLAIDLVDARKVADGDVPDWRTLRDELRSPVPGCVSAFVDATKELLVVSGRSRATPMLVIDQFEELLSREDTTDAARFLDFLSCLMAYPQSPWRCVATVRTDHLEAVQRHPALVACQAWSAQYPLYRMPTERLYDVVRLPAEKAGIEFESDALVDRIVGDTESADALPLLAFALRELHDRFAADHRIADSEYNELGGIRGCLAKVAHRTLLELGIAGASSTDARSQALYTSFSSHLVRVDDEDHIVRRTARWTELPENARPMLERFVTRRLLTSRGGSDDDDGTYVEVAHEALFREWEDLANWLDERLDLLRWRTDVERSRKAAGDSWPGLTASQRTRAGDWPTTRAGELRPEEIGWIHAAVRRARLWWTGLSVAAAVLALSTVLSVVFWRGSVEQRDAAIAATARAEQEASIAESRRLAILAETQVSKRLDVGILLALEANRVPTDEAASTLQSVFQTRPLVARLLTSDEGVKVSRVALGPAGEYVVSEFYPRRITLYGGDGTKRWTHPLNSFAEHVRVGRTVISVASNDRSPFIQAFRSSDGTSLFVHELDVGERVKAVATAGEGLTVALVSGDRPRAIMIDGEGTVVWETSFSDGLDVAISDDGQVALLSRSRVALMNANGTEAWSRPDDEQVPDPSFRFVAIDDRTGRVAVCLGSYPTEIHVFDEGGELVFKKTVELPVMSNPTFLDKGGVAVAVHDTNEISAVYMWGPTGKVLSTWDVPSGLVEDVTWSPESGLIIATRGEGGEGVRRTYFRDAPRLLSAPLKTVHGRVHSLIGSANGSLLTAVVGDDGRLVVENSAGKRLYQSPAVSNVWRRFALSPDGRLVASFDRGREITLLPALDGDRSSSDGADVPLPPFVVPGFVKDIAFTRDGRLLVVHQDGGVSYFEDLEGNRSGPTPFLDTPVGYEALAVGTSGHVAVVSARAAGFGVAVFGEDGKPVQHEPVDVSLSDVGASHIEDVAVGPNGEVVVCFNTFRGCKVYGFDVGGEAMWREPLHLDNGVRHVNCLSVMEDGEILIAYEMSGTERTRIATLHADPESWQRVLEDTVNRNLTWAEWRRYFPSRENEGEYQTYRRTIRSRPWPSDLPDEELARAMESESADNSK